MRLSKLKIIIVIIILIGAFSMVSNRPRFEIQEKGKHEIRKIAGEIGVSFRTNRKQWSFIISNGGLAPINDLPDAPDEAKIITAKQEATSLLSKVDGVEYSGLYLVSPDKTTVVIGIMYKDSDAYNPTDFVLGNIKENVVIYKRKAESLRFIDSIAWSPDSRFFAILDHSSKLKFDLISIISSISGHPVRKKNYNLEVYDQCH
jgi:hypothetical protein